METTNIRELINELVDQAVNAQGYAFAAGTLQTLLVDSLESLPKKKQQEAVKLIQRIKTNADMQGAR